MSEIVEKKPFVTCKYTGGVGNQFFQAASAIATALRNGAEYKLPSFTMNTDLWKLALPHLGTYDGEKDLIENHFKEDEGFKFRPIEYEPNLCLSGYFQSEKHFADYKDEIRKAFGFPEKWSEGVVAIHHRFGDFRMYPTKFPIPSFEDYYLRAIERFPNHRFMIFSDEPESIKSLHKDMANGRCIFMPKGDPIRDLKIMSRCEHFIIANSTFSWFGAWLCANPAKIVISPSAKNWFGEGNKHLTTEHIIPDNWIQIEY